MLRGSRLGTSSTRPDKPGTAAPARPQARASASFDTLYWYRLSTRLFCAAGQRGLRGDQRQVVVHAGVHAVGFVAQRARGQVDVRSRHVHQLGIRVHVQQRRAHLLVDVVAQIVELRIRRLPCWPATTSSSPRSLASRKIGKLKLPQRHESCHACPRRSRYWSGSSCRSSASAAVRREPTRAAPCTPPAGFAGSGSPGGSCRQARTSSGVCAASSL